MTLQGVKARAGFGRENARSAIETAGDDLIAERIVEGDGVDDIFVT